MNNDLDTNEMDKYKCHKEVWALKIEEVLIQQDGCAVLVFCGSKSGKLLVKEGYVRRHRPVSGGYYVVYRDGYASFSPGSAFEEGYSKVN